HADARPDRGLGQLAALAARLEHLAKLFRSAGDVIHEDISKSGYAEYIQILGYFQYIQKCRCSWPPCLASRRLKVVNITIFGVVVTRSISAAEANRQFSQMLRGVREEGATYVVTAHGRPVARIVPVDTPQTSRPGPEALLQLERRSSEGGSG